MIEAAVVKNSNINASDKKLRDFILNKNLWLVVLRISLPLIFINAMHYLYGIIDSIMAAEIDSTAISTVVILGQISNMIMSLGYGFAGGGIIIIARLIGRNDFAKAKTVANTIIFIAAIISIITIAVVVPSTKFILRIANTPESLISAGTAYFMIQIISVGVMVFNNVYLGLEKARGQTQSILILNFAVIIVKIVLSYIFIYIFHYGLTMVAVATLIANFMLTLYVIIRLVMPKYIFKFKFSDKNLSKDFLKPIFVLSFPIFLGKFVFSLGKVIVNSMCSFYGDRVVGALGVSNNMGGYVSTVIGSVEESSSMIISTNLGQKNKKRALKAFYYSFVINLGLAILGVILLTVFNDAIIGFYSKGDKAFGQMISDIFAYEKLGIIALGINSSMLGLLNGFGFTKITMFTNLSRLFVFRIPTLVILMNFTDLGFKSTGIAMFISNGGIGLMSIVIGIIYLIKIKRKNIVDDLKVGANAEPVTI